MTTAPIALQLWQGTVASFAAKGTPSARADQPPAEHLARVIDRTFDPFRWRNVPGRGALNKQLRDRPDAPILSVAIETTPRLRIRVWLSDSGTPLGRLRTIAAIVRQRQRIAQAAAGRTR